MQVGTRLANEQGAWIAGRHIIPLISQWSGTHGQRRKGRRRAFIGGNVSCRNCERWRRVGIENSQQFKFAELHTIGVGVVFDIVEAHFVVVVSGNIGKMHFLHVMGQRVDYISRRAVSPGRQSEGTGRDR